MSMYVAWLLLVPVALAIAPDQYITYQPGNMPLIISAPHGGNEKPDEFPDRTAGCYVNKKCFWGPGCTPNPSKCGVKILKDSYTKDIAEEISRHILSLTGRSPYLVINELHRSKLDANREVGEATGNNVLATEAYMAFADRIMDAKQQIGDDPALFLDIHGQTHSEEWTEVGYTRTKARLNSEEFRLDLSSIKALADRVCHDRCNTCYKSLVSGADSLGKFMDDKLMKTVPSPSNPTPGSSGNYKSGGYDLKAYGSRYGGNVDAIQLELPKSLRFGDDRLASADTIAEAVVAFMQHHGYISSS